MNCQSIACNLQKGFSLIELMIVVSIIGILAALALPAYQGYVIRSKISEGLALADAAKLAVVETFQATGIVAGSNSAANYTFAATPQVSDISILSGGVVRITYSVPQVTGYTLLFTPNMNGSALATGVSNPINWVCKSAGSPASGATMSTFGGLGTLPSRFAPASCRG